MTEKQMTSTAGMVRNVCQPKTKVTNGQIDNMHKGEFEDNNQPKCYMKCVFETLKLMKNGKFDYNSALKQAATLPAQYAEATKATAAKCKDSVLSSVKLPMNLQSVGITQTLNIMYITENSLGSRYLLNYRQRKVQIPPEPVLRPAGGHCLPARGKGASVGPPCETSQ
ncbi:Odorant-binding protein 19a [Carabus blaptoides fortunei]